MKFYSKIFKAKTIVSVFIILWIIILILITINHTLSCVNIKGCLKESCKGKKKNNNNNNNDCKSFIRSSYCQLIEASCNN